MTLKSITRLACCCLAASVVSLTTPQQSSAGLIIDLQNGSTNPVLNPGDTLTLDVWLESDIDDAIEDFTFSLNINANGGNVDTAGLQFIDPQDESYLNDPDYVFFGTSESLMFGPPATMVMSDFETNDVLQFDDLFTDPLGVDFDAPLDAGERFLIGRYEIEAQLTAVAGDSFEITLDPTSIFTVNDFDNFTPNSLTVTIAAVAVPEPSSLALLAFGSAPIIMRRRKRDDS